MSDPLTVKCPACGALPNNPCARIDGKVLPGPHRRRKEHSLGITVPSRAVFLRAWVAMQLQEKLPLWTAGWTNDEALPRSS